MPACQLTREQRRGRAELHLEGTFDGAAAWDLVQRLPRERVDQIDFSHVGTFVDHGLAVLAHALTLRRNPVALVGLRRHQLRLLRYLGVDVSDDGTVPAAV
jgi:hypothetical protein